MVNPNDYVMHENPVWRDRSNFIIDAEIPEEDRPRRFEQLFTRKLAKDLFEICCIPFFLYDVALGDVVRTLLEGDRKYVVDRVVEASGRYVFRVLFSGFSGPPCDELSLWCRNLGQRSSGIPQPCLP